MGISLFRSFCALTELKPASCHTNRQHLIVGFSCILYWIDKYRSGHERETKRAPCKKNDASYLFCAGELSIGLDTKERQNESYVKKNDDSYLFSIKVI